MAYPPGSSTGSPTVKPDVTMPSISSLDAVQLCIRNTVELLNSLCDSTSLPIVPFERKGGCEEVPGTGEIARFPAETLGTQKMGTQNTM
jgi:hypothetical protein